MTAFFEDADLTGALEFADPELTLATEFTVPDGIVNSMRWRCPTTTPSVTPAFRIYDAGGSTVATIPLDGAVAGNAWNPGTPGSPVVLTAGTYRMSINTTDYLARAGFFPAPIVRGDITGVQSRFANGVAPPGGTSTSAYFVDMDFVADGPAEGAAAIGVAVAAAAVGARASQAAAAVVIDLAVSAAGARRSAGVGAVGVVLQLAAQGARGSAGVGAVGVVLAAAAVGARASRGASAVSIVLAADARAGVAPPGGGGPRLTSLSRLQPLSTTTRGPGG